MQERKMVQAQVISAWLARTCASIYDVSAHPDLGSMAIEHLPERFDTPNQHSRPESVPNAWDTQPKSPIYHLPSSYDTSQLLEEDLGNHDDILAHFHNSPTDFGFNNFGTGSQYHDPPHDQIESPSFWNEFINSQMHSDLTNFGPSFEAPVTHSIKEKKKRQGLHCRGRFPTLPLDNRLFRFYLHEAHGYSPTRRLYL